MTWESALPILQNTIGGLAMGIFIWATVTGRINLPRETQVYKTLYEEEKTDRIKLETQNDELVADLRKSHDTLNETAKALQNANNLLTGLLNKQGVATHER